MLTTKNMSRLISTYIPYCFVHTSPFRLLFQWRGHVKPAGFFSDTGWSFTLLLCFLWDPSTTTLLSFLAHLILASCTYCFRSLWNRPLNITLSSASEWNSSFLFFRDRLTPLLQVTRYGYTTSPTLGALTRYLFHKSELRFSFLLSALLLLFVAALSSILHCLLSLFLASFCFTDCILVDWPPLESTTSFFFHCLNTCHFENLSQSVITNRSFFNKFDLTNLPCSLLELPCPFDSFLPYLHQNSITDSQKGYNGPQEH